MNQPFLLDIALKAAVLLSAATVATLTMHRMSAAARHLVWCATAVAVLCLPLLSAVLPAWRVLPRVAEAPAQPQSQPLELMTPNAAPTIAPAAEQVPRPVAVQRRVNHLVDPGDVVVMLWFAGTLLCLLPPLIGWLRLRRLARRCDRVADTTSLRLVAQASSELGLRRPIALMVRDVPTMPMTWGIYRPIVLLPREALKWPHHRRRAVLLHELAHVKRLDCLTHLIGQLARAVYWFNPLAWVLVGRMSIERERACDDLVLRAGIRQSAYARELLAVGTRLPPAPRGLAAMAMAMARPSRMERRLRDVLDDRRNRRPLTRRHLLTAAALVALVAIPTACANWRGGGEDATQSRQKASSKQSRTALTPEQAECQKHLAILVRAAQHYSEDHLGRLPPSLGETLHYVPAAKKSQFPNDPALPPAHYYLCPLDNALAGAPENITPQWIHQNTLYTYLAPDLRNVIGKFPNTVMIHERLGWKKHGDTINVAFFDGRVEAMERDEAARVIELSRARIDAAWAERAARKDSPPTPPHQRLAEKVNQQDRTGLLNRANSNMRRVGLAALLYAADHDHRMPPDLGQTLKYVDGDLSPAAGARVFLLPRDQHGMKWPAAPTPAWINENTSYVYLAKDVDLKKLPDDVKGRTIMFHTKLEAPLKGATGRDIILTVWLDGHAEATIAEMAKQEIDRSRKMHDAARVPGGGE